MKSEVFFVSAAPTARGDKKSLDVQVKLALDASLASHPGASIVALNVAADIISNFQKALVTVVYDGGEEAEAPKTKAPKTGK